MSKRWGFLGLIGLMALTLSAVAAEHMPSCQLQALDNHQHYEMTQFRGQVVFVDFWASWCSSCVQSFPLLNQLHQDFNRQGLQVLGINVDENLADATQFIQRHPANFQVLTDSTQHCPKAFGVLGMPASYLIDRQGVIRFVHLGFRTSHGAQLRAQIEQLLHEKTAEL